MASIGTLLPSQNSSSAATTTTSNGSTKASGEKDPLANQTTFLTLLVTQLKNQNPTSPMDGTAFVTQLAQFSNLEQNVAMRQDLDTLTTKYAPATAATAAQNSGSTTDAGSNKDSSGNNKVSSS